MCLFDICLILSLNKIKFHLSSSFSFPVLPSPPPHSLTNPLPPNSLSLSHPPVLLSHSLFLFSIAFFFHSIPLPLSSLSLPHSTIRFLYLILSLSSTPSLCFLSLCFSNFPSASHFPIQSLLSPPLCLCSLSLSAICPSLYLSFIPPPPLSIFYLFSFRQPLSHSLLPSFLTSDSLYSFPPAPRSPTPSLPNQFSPHTAQPSS